MIHVLALKALTAIALVGIASGVHASDSRKISVSSVKAPGYIGGPGSSYVKKVAQYHDRDDDRDDKREKKKEREKEREKKDKKDKDKEHGHNPSRC